MSAPKIAQKTPYVLDLKSGKYYYCSCGHSTKQPFCNGSHAGSEFVPKHFELDEDKKVAICGCKHTANAPYCDGSHTKI